MSVYVETVIASPFLVSTKKTPGSPTASVFARDGRQAAPGRSQIGPVVTLLPLRVRMDRFARSSAGRTVGE
jgi:hypothetical protein